MKKNKRECRTARLIDRKTEKDTERESEREKERVLCVCSHSSPANPIFEECGRW